MFNEFGWTESEWVLINSVPADERKRILSLLDSTDSNEEGEE